MHILLIYFLLGAASGSDVTIIFFVKPKIIFDAIVFWNLYNTRNSINLIYLADFVFCVFVQFQINDVVLHQTKNIRGITWSGICEKGGTIDNTK